MGGQRARHPDPKLTSGRRSNTVRLVEVPVEERRPLLLRQLRAEPGTGTLAVGSGLVAAPAPEADSAAAERIAVFRIDTL